MIQMSSMKITLCITNVWGLRDPYEWFKTWSNNGCLHSKIKKPDSDSKKKKKLFCITKVMRCIMGKTYLRF